MPDRPRRVIADSEATRRDLMRVYGTAGDKIAVVHLGRDESFAPVRDPECLAEIRARYGIEGDYLLYVGTLQPRKNLLRLLEAFGRIAAASEAQDVQLVLAGQPGWQAREIEERADLPRRARASADHGLRAAGGPARPLLGCARFRLPLSL